MNVKQIGETVQYQMENPPVMTAEQARQGHYNPKAFFPKETYCVWDTSTGCPVQSDATAGMAERSCSILNNHEIKNGRLGGYRWFQFAAPCQTV